jgi:drug/metabolite transporter (DMT)-like permease
MDLSFKDMPMHRFENLPDEQKALLVGIGSILLGCVLFALYYADVKYFNRTSKFIGASILAVMGILLVVISIMIRRSK